MLPPQGEEVQYSTEGLILDRDVEVGLVAREVVNPDPGEHPRQRRSAVKASHPSKPGQPPNRLTI